MKTSIYRIAVLILMLGVAETAHADYQVTNYSGEIGTYKIHLSLQYYDHFGSGLNVEGSYYYDKHMSPIPLYGIRSAQGTLSLCEVRGEEEYQKVFVHGLNSPLDPKVCQFHLVVSENSAKGVWEDGRRRYNVKLEEVARMDNGRGTRAIEIPYWGQTNEHMFMGVYEFEGGKESAKIKVLEKKSGRVIQKFVPNKDECNFGFFMTSIYMNIESRTPQGVILNCWCRQYCPLTEFSFNKATNKYELFTNSY